MYKTYMYMYIICTCTLYVHNYVTGSCNLHYFFIYSGCKPISHYILSDILEAIHESQETHYEEMEECEFLELYNRIPPMFH